MKFSVTKLMKNCALLVLAGVLVAGGAGCASRNGNAPPAGESRVIRVSDTKQKAPTPASVPSPGVARPNEVTGTGAPASSAPSAKPAPLRRPSFAEEVAQQVPNARLVSAVEKRMVFSAKDSRGSSSQSLFEDAIALGKIRANLKTAGVSRHADQVSVSSGVVTLRASRAATAQEIASSVRKIFDIEGVQRVKVVIAGSEA